VSRPNVSGLLLERNQVKHRPFGQRHDVACTSQFDAEVIDEECSCTVANDLMNGHDDASRLILCKRNRFNGRIENLPLPHPVAPHGIVPVYKATFHAVLPLDVGMHG
jgi:hypothetical protein